MENELSIDKRIAKITDNINEKLIEVREIIQRINGEDCNFSQEVEEEIVLTKKNGLWQMDKYKDGKVITATGKELVIALLDLENPLAVGIVEGENLGHKYKGFHIKADYNSEINQHKCFDDNEEAINHILKNKGLVIAFSPDDLPRTEKFNKYLEEHDIVLPQEEIK